MEKIDTQLFYWINQHHNTLLDHILWISSQGWSWAIVITLFFCIGTLRLEPRKWLWVLVGIGLCFLLSDRISVMCFKNVVCRLRPCHALDNVRMFQTSCGGRYGFVSSHAANVFALALFLSLRYNRALQQRGLLHGWWCNHVYSLLLFTWAIIVGYSRPYLGKHYPGDVLCGALVGLGMGALVYFICFKTEQWFACKKQTKNT